MLNHKLKYLFVAVFLLIIIVGGSVLFMVHSRIFKNNVDTGNEKIFFLYISTGSEYNDVLKLLEDNRILRDTSSFDWVARKKNYPRHINPGKYKIRKGMNNNQLINLLRSGRQEPVQLIFNSMRTLEKLAAVISSQIEADSADLLNLLLDVNYLQELGMAPETVRGYFIPNTYEFYWNTSADQFIRRMIKEYNRFWTRQRIKKAEAIGLSPMEVITLASIVDEETLMKEEEKKIAGVYINRLKRKMRLNADPTVKFAAGDMNIRRILNKHLAIDSPYNTYRYAGLPPGPIAIPSISAIDAVLDYEQHDYLFFCAKDDFSGYHVFAKTLAQHNKNARSYQKALNQRKILN